MSITTYTIDEGHIQIIEDLSTIEDTLIVSVFAGILFPGLPLGGNTGQILAKKSNVSNDNIWVDNDKSKTYIFETVELFEAWIAVLENIEKLRAGDEFRIITEDNADYWWDGNNIHEQEVNLKNVIQTINVLPTASEYYLGRTYYLIAPQTGYTAYVFYQCQFIDNEYLWKDVEPEYILPKASSTIRGGVMADVKTENDVIPANIANNEKLYVDAVRGSTYIIDINNAINNLLYSISYMDNNIPLIGLTPVSYGYLDGVSVLPIPEKEGYIFIGWYLNNSFSGDIITSINENSYGNIILYAKFEEE